MKVLELCTSLRHNPRCFGFACCARYMRIKTPVDQDTHGRVLMPGSCETCNADSLVLTFWHVIIDHVAAHAAEFDCRLRQCRCFFVLDGTVLAVCVVGSLC